MLLEPTNYTISPNIQKQLMGHINKLQHIHKIPELKDKLVDACSKSYANAREAAETIHSLRATMKHEYSLELHDEVSVLDGVLSEVIGTILGPSELPQASMEEKISSTELSAGGIAKPAIIAPPFSPTEISEMLPHRNYNKFVYWAVAIASTESVRTFLEQYLTPENVNLTLNIPPGDETMLSNLSKGDRFSSLIPLFAKKGAQFNQVSSQWHNTPLTWAIANGSYASALALIRTGLCDFTIKDAYGKTPLHLLVAKNYTNVTKDGDPILRPTTELIEEMMAQVHDKPQVKQALLDSQDALGNTALHIACLRRDTKTIAYLLNQGARTDITNSEGKRPVDMLNAPKEQVQSILDWMTNKLYVAPEGLSDPVALRTALKLLSP